MYEHLRKLEKYINQKITWLKAPRNFEYYFFEYHPQRKNPVLEQYAGMSWPSPRNLLVYWYVKNSYNICLSAGFTKTV